MSHSPNASPTSQILPQDPWKKPWTKGLIIGASLGVFYLAGTLFLYKSVVTFDGIINSAFVTCTQGTLAYGGGHIFTFLMRSITILGSNPFLALATCAICIWLYLRKMLPLALFFGLQMIAGLVFTYTLKFAFNRPRPNSTCLDQSIWTGSFPSGHVMMSTIFLGTLIFLLIRMPSYYESRSLLTTSAIALSLAIGISRLYLGVHWFSDVLGGWLFGFLWTIMGLNLLTYWEQKSYARHS